MDKDYKQDNIIQWVFEKAFDQLTFESRELFETPFDKIKKKTFDNVELYQLINKLTRRQTNKIIEYLTNKQFQEKFLFSKIKKKLYVQILLGDLDKIKLLIDIGHVFDQRCMQLAVLNNRIDILQYIIETNLELKLENQLLIYCCEFGHENMYFYLREKGLMPNITIYNKAALGNSFKIILDTNENIGISNKTLMSSFQANNTDIILFLVDIAKSDNIKINNNLFTYPILNNNFTLLTELEKLNMIVWPVLKEQSTGSNTSRYHELYYSALLSGSIEMVKYIESKMPNIHDNHTLDTSKTKKGQMSLLLEDIIYEINNKKYFSHTMNYAVQSGSIAMVKYVYAKGYGITVSNFITAIKQGTVEILEYLCTKYSKKLPFYLVHYFGINSYASEKMAKAKILIDNRLLDLNITSKMTVNDYRKESAHLEIISQTVQIPEDGVVDPDYLMKYQLFFIPVSGYKFNHKLLTKTRICLELGMDDELINIFTAQMNRIDQQFVIDTLFLFGNMAQIKKLSWPLAPSNQIIMEMMCYNQLNKLCYLVQNNLLSDTIIDCIYPVATMLSDEYLTILFQKIGRNNPDIKYMLLSGNYSVITKWLDNNIFDENNTDINIFKYALQLDNIDIAKRLRYPKKLLSELIDWASESDLVEMHSYLKSVEICELIMEKNDV